MIFKTTTKLLLFTAAIVVITLGVRFQVNQWLYGVAWLAAVLLVTETYRQAHELEYLRKQMSDLHLSPNEKEIRDRDAKNRGQ